jgi:hypothetical protein
MKSGLIKSGLMAVGSLVLAVSADAQLPVQVYTFNNDELLLGFTIPPSTGDLVIDLGKVADVGVGGSAVVDLNAHGNVGKTAAELLTQLSALYGNMSSLSWGVVGGHFSPSSAVYCTVPHGAPAPVLGAAGNLGSAFNTVGSSIDGSGIPKNQQVIDPTAGSGLTWTENIASPISMWQLNGTNPNSTTSSSFATGGLKHQMADLYLKNYSGSTGSSPLLVGYLSLGNDGSLTFTPGTNAPPPSLPPPPLLAIKRAGNVTTISFVTTNSATYSLYFTNSSGLSVPVANWGLSSTTITGNGGAQSFIDTTADSDRVYRVLAH